MRTTSQADLAVRLRLVIARTARRLRQESAPELSPSQAAALATIDRHGPLTPSEIAVRERIQRPTATRLIARLEQADFLDRTPDPADRRSCVVSLTPAGRELLGRVRLRKDAYLSRRLRDLDADERATLDRAAAILERVLEEDGA
jgi:DNA-binding MarR family transcriptional regulator